MNNAWSEIVTSTPCLALYSPWSPRLLQTIWDNSTPTTDQPCRLITTLLLLVLYIYDYEQPNAPFPTSMTLRACLNTLDQRGVQYKALLQWQSVCSKPESSRKRFGRKRWQMRLTH